MNLQYIICILAQRGRFLETILKDGARSGVPRTRREPPRGRSGPRPPGINVWRGQSLRLRFHCREPAAWVLDRKSPRWSAERGSRSSRGGPRLTARASRLARATESKECACRRSIHPSSGVRESVVAEDESGRLACAPKFGEGE